MDNAALSNQYVEGRCIDCHRYVERKARDIHPDNCSERRTEHYRAVAQSLGLEISPPTKQVGPVHYWPEGYRRPRDGFTLVMETGVVGLGLGLGLSLISKSEGAGVLILLAMLILLGWLEWSTRCENRSLVAKVSAAIIAAEAAPLAYQHERREREAAQQPQRDAYWAAQRADSKRRIQEDRQHQFVQEQYSRDEWQRQNNPQAYLARPIPPPTPQHPDGNALDFGGGR